MKNLPLFSRVFFWFLVFGTCQAQAAEDELLYANDFESGSIGDGWDTEVTGQGRVRVQALTVGGSSSNWLVLDDDKSDSTFSVSAAGFELPVSGMSLLRISFDLYSPGDQENPEVEWGDAFQVWVDGERVFAYNFFEAPREGSNDVGRANIELSIEGMAGDFDPRRVYNVVFVFNQYGSKPWPTEGWAIDNIQVVGVAAVGTYLFYEPIVNENHGSLEVDVAVSPVPDQDIGFSVVKDEQEVLAFTYRAGLSGMQVALPIEDNDTFNLSYTHHYRFDRSDGVPGGLTVLIMENEVPSFRWILPESINEGESVAGNAVVRISPALGERMNLRIDGVGDSGNRIGQVFQPLEAGETDFVFDLYAYSDYRILEDRTERIRVSLQEFSSEANILVKESDYFELVFQQGQNQFELEGETVPVTISTRSYVSEDLQILLWSNDEGSLEMPESVMVRQGNNISDTFEVTILDNDRQDGIRAFEMHAAFADDRSLEGIGYLQVRDNEVAGFDIDFGPMVEEGQMFEVTIIPLDLAGVQMDYFKGPVNATIILADGTERALTGDGKVTFSYGAFQTTVPGSADLEGARLRITDSAGRVFMSSESVILFGRESLGFRDIVYSEVRDKWYATVRSDAPAASRNSLVELDGETGEVLRRLSFGSGADPRALELSKDASTVFVGIDGRRSMAMVDLGNFELLKEFTLVENNRFVSENYGSDPFTARDILTVEGRPLDVLVSQHLGSSSYAATSFYRNGEVVLQDVTEDQAQEFAYDSVNGRIFAYESRSSSGEFFWLSLSNNGYEIEKGAIAPFFIYSSQIEYLEGKIYCSDGRVADAENLTLLGQFVDFDGQGIAGTFLALDADSRRAYFCRGSTLVMCSLDGLHPIAEYDFGGQSDLKKAVLGSGNRIALLFEDGRVTFLEKSQVVPSGSAASLGLTVVMEDTVELGEPLPVVLRLENLGDSVAHAADVVLRLEGASYFREAVTTVGSAFLEGGKVMRVEFGDLAPGQAAELRFDVVLSKMENSTLTVLGSSSDPVQAGDVRVATRTIKPFKSLEVGEFVEIPVEGELLYWDAVNRWLYVYDDTDWYPGYDYGIEIIDVDTATVVGRISTEAAICGVHATANGKHLWIAETYPAQIKKIDLSDFSVVETITAAEAGGQLLQFKRVLLIDELTRDFLVWGTRGMARMRNGLFMDTMALGSFELDGGPVLDRQNGLVHGIRASFGGSTLKSFALVDDGVVALPDKALKRSESALDVGDGVLWASRGSRLEGVDRLSLDFPSRLPGGPEWTTSDGDFLGVVAAASEQRVYYLDKRSVVSLDSVSGNPIRREHFPAFSSWIGSGVRWGEDGFAFWLGDTVALARLESVSDGPYSFDLKLEQGFGLRVLEEPELVLAGSCFAGGAIESVQVNGVTVDTEDGFATWSATVSGLSNGLQSIRIVAKAEDGRVVARDLIVYLKSNDDADVDGIPDAWEKQYYPNSAIELIDPLEDRDGDGLNAMLEYLLGSDPTKYDRPWALSTDKGPLGSRLLVSFQLREGVGNALSLRLLDLRSGQVVEPTIEAEQTGGSAGYRSARAPILLNANELNLWIMEFIPITLP